MSHHGLSKRSARKHLVSRRAAHDYLMRHNMPDSGPVTKFYVDPALLEKDANGKWIVP